MSYATTVLADNPVLYWRLEETSGNAADSSVNSHTGTVFGANLDTAGPTDLLGSAAAFDGIDDYIIGEGANAGVLNIDGNKPKSIECWVKILTWPADTTHVMFVGSFNTGRAFAFITGSGANNWIFNLWGGTGWDIPFTVADSVGRWVHLVATHDGTHARVYADGVEAGWGERTLDTHPTDQDFQIARRPSPLRYVHGVMDEVAVYDTALSPARVEAHYDAAYAPADDPANLQATVDGSDVHLTWDPVGT